MTIIIKKLKTWKIVKINAYKKFKGSVLFFIIPLTFFFKLW